MKPGLPLFRLILERLLEQFAEDVLRLPTPRLRMQIVVIHHARGWRPADLPLDLGKVGFACEPLYRCAHVAGARRLGASGISLGRRP